VDPGRGLKKSCQPESNSRWRIIYFIFGGASVLQDWEYGKYDVFDCPVLSSVPLIVGGFSNEAKQANLRFQVKMRFSVALSLEGVLWCTC
jgi:hypothetical protein